VARVILFKTTFGEIVNIPQNVLIHGCPERTLAENPVARSARAIRGQGEVPGLSVERRDGLAPSWAAWSAAASLAYASGALSHCQGLLVPLALALVEGTPMPRERGGTRGHRRQLPPESA
jgi:hypothetical protein